jgi:hypothetical protein
VPRARPQRGVKLVLSSWVSACEAAGAVISEDDHVLSGVFASQAGASTRWSFDAGESLRRAAVGPCLAGLTFFLSANVVPKPAQLALIVEAAGGKVTQRLPPAPTGDEQTQYYAVLELPKDKVRARVHAASARIRAAPRATHDTARLPRG